MVCTIPYEIYPFPIAREYSSPVDCEKGPNVEHTYQYGIRMVELVRKEAIERGKSDEQFGHGWGYCQFVLVPLCRGAHDRMTS